MTLCYSISTLEGVVIKEHIAYEGKFFVIEWFYNEKDESQPLDYFMNLSETQQNKLFYLFKRMGDFGKIHNKAQFRYEGDDIFAFKPQPDRFLCFFVKGGKIIITNAFRKTTDKLPGSDKTRALERRQDYLKRIEEETYYDREN